MASRSNTHDRDAALNRALALFWKQGFHATSLKDLEAALGMHPGSIYAAFGNKESLFRMALDRYATQMAAEQARIADEAPGILEGLARFIGGGHPVARGDLPVPACFLAKTTLDTGVDQPEIRAALHDLLDRSEAAFADRFRAAQAAGELSPDADPDRLARRLQVELTGIGFYALRPNRRGAARQMAVDLADDIRRLGDAGRPGTTAWLA
ncbi:MAG: TetR/AcrR family transcriptional regulator [Rhodobacteraceae bacterium]|nr:TetR/AcrR family transcriptional regulator [Paracoccaceae bacterium]